MTEMVIETSVQYVHLTRLIAREDYINFWTVVNQNWLLKLWIRLDISVGLFGRGVVGGRPKGKQENTAKRKSAYTDGLRGNRTHSHTRNCEGTGSGEL